MSRNGPDLNPTENLWHDFKIVVNQRKLFNLELKQFWLKEWVNIPVAMYKIHIFKRRDMIMEHIQISYYPYLAVNVVL